MHHGRLCLPLWPLPSKRPAFSSYLAYSSSSTVQYHPGSFSISVNPIGPLSDDPGRSRSIRTLLRPLLVLYTLGLTWWWRAMPCMVGLVVSSSSTTCQQMSKKPRTRDYYARGLLGAKRRRAIRTCGGRLSFGRWWLVGWEGSVINGVVGSRAANDEAINGQKQLLLVLRSIALHWPPGSGLAGYDCSSALVSSRLVSIDRLHAARYSFPPMHKLHSIVDVPRAPV